jgi:hypothetical protein
MGSSLTREDIIWTNAKVLEVRIKNLTITRSEKGDFKFAHPSADITGLIKVIESLTDLSRMNHGLRPKYQDSLPASGFSLMMEKIGVIEDNIRRGKLFKEREEQMFQIIKNLWNLHNNKAGQKKFSPRARLKVTYVKPEFPTDPKTELETLMIQNKLLDSGDRASFRKLYPHLDDIEINKLLSTRRKDKMEQSIVDAEVEVAKAKVMIQAGLDPKITNTTTKTEGDNKRDEKLDVGGKEPEAPKMDNRMKHSQDSGKQRGKNGDLRGEEK